MGMSTFLDSFLATIPDAKPLSQEEAHAYLDLLDASFKLPIQVAPLPEGVSAVFGYPVEVKEGGDLGCRAAAPRRRG